jgi:hypothetical protein
MPVPELIGDAGGLGWVAVKAVLLFAVAVIGLRLGERRTLAQLSAFDFAVAVAVGAIIGRGATAADTSFATSAVALITPAGRASRGCYRPQAQPGRPPDRPSAPGPGRPRRAAGKGAGRRRADGRRRVRTAARERRR